MELSTLLALPAGLEVVSTTASDKLLTVRLAATTESGICPLCGHAATHVRSYYTRFVADVPCAGRHVQLILRVRKFRCDTVSCPRKIFAERLGPFIEAWARKTTRLRKEIEAIGLSTCGEVGARLADRLAIATSPTTILRRIMDLPLLPVGTVTHLGIDDFALRRGRTYGTVLVNLKSHKVLDLLPDRQAKTAQVWMEAHPEIDLVSRDRGGDYAAAARKGAPQATQTADRFHLVKNLSETVEKALMQCRAEIRKSTQTEDSEAPPPDSDSQPMRSTRDADRYDRYQRVVQLRKQGMKLRDIAKRLGMGERTVRSWLSHGSYPETHYHKRSSRFDAYASYVKQRWDGGCHNIQQIWREIKAQGYPHSARALRDQLAGLGRKKKVDQTSDSTADQFEAKAATWLFIRRITDLDEKERAELETIRQTSETVETIYQLVQEFLQMVRKREGEQLENWLAKVRASPISELHHFANGIERDKAAVLAGLTLIYSNGQTEGQVTRIKLIKRMMYGRAGFALLRQRVLHRF